MKEIFFTADTHFGSERSLTLSRRPFDNVTEMDTEMIRLWNKDVKPGDTVYHGGDFGDYTKVKELNGDIILVLGNYEIKDLENGIITKEYLLDLGFKDVIDNITVDNFNVKMPEITKIHVTHQPDQCIIDPEVFNLFGHIHGRQLVKKFGLDVGVDGHHFRLLSTKDICFYMEAIKKHYDHNVFM